MKLIPFETTGLPIEIDATARVAGAEIVFEIQVSGDLTAIDWSAPGMAGERLDELWKRTCFEAFVAIPDGQYWEFNIAPSGAWNVYRFDSYRNGMKPEERLSELTIDFRRSARELVVRWNAPVEIFRDAELRVGLTSVIVSATDKTSYWALKHTGEQADFHLSESFLLSLESGAP